MSVPEEIRKVPRPKNTVVIDYGDKAESCLRYAVRERKGVRYIPHGNPQPISGRVIGHIVHGRFVPIQPRLEKMPDFLSFGPSALVYSVGQDIYDDLLSAYEAGEATQIMVIACVKAIAPSVRYSRISTEYEANWLSLYYPNVPLTKNTVCELLQKIGMSSGNREKFYNERFKRVAESHHIVIDGMLKTDTSVVNNFSAFSRKARIKGCQDISILYAFDLEKEEPICSEVFPGNCIDATSYHSFISDNKIDKGIIVVDKGFPRKAIDSDLSSHPKLHYLTPLKRNDRRISDNKMLNFEEPLIGTQESLFAKKTKLKDGHYLYAFRDVDLAALEEKTLARAAIHGHGFDKDSYQKKRDGFGSIVFESDIDLELPDVYKIYSARWEIELLFKAFKNEELLEQTCVQSNYSVIGSEFVNFVATVLARRMHNAAKKAKLLERQTFSELLRDLSRTFRRVSCKDKPPVYADDGWIGCMPKPMGELVALKLCSEDEDHKAKAVVNRVTDDATPRKRGRPRKHPLPDPNLPKRPRGRPRKNPAPATTSSL